ncbi:hypothetical protein AB0M46_23425 [Dactylosporangium sp. NPDC051485]|uniref:hypothetical protein n=1 Tax=Dactylosporangium sp. NPDC051485 TaxID=3154846 RepID=UPI00343C5814
MTPELSSKPLVIRGLVALAMSLLGRVMIAWLVGDPPADAQLGVAAVDYTTCGVAVLTMALIGWWAGTSAQSALSRSIDRRFTAGLRRWRGMPRSRTHDLLFVNAVAVFVLRISNAAVRPVWRRSIGLTTAVLLITATWLAADAVTPAHLPTTAGAAAAAAVFHGLGVCYVQTGAAAAWVGCIVLTGNALHVAGQMLLGGESTGRPAAIRCPGRRRPSRRRRGTPPAGPAGDRASPRF